MDTKGITLLDGGMGQELIRLSQRPPTGLWSTQVMMDEPELVRQVHDAYFAAGAQVATTNSYAVHRDRLEPVGLGDRFEELQRLACQIAKDARDAHGSGLVAGSLGPLGWSYSHDGAPEGSKAEALYSEICDIQSDLVDVFLIETIAAVDQARAAVKGASGHGKPVWIGLTVNDKDGTRLRSGEPITEALEAMQAAPPAAVVLNCSIPEAVTQGLSILRDAGVTFGAYANGFTEISPEFLGKYSTVKELERRQDLGPAAYAEHAAQWIDLGATIVGGCCEVGPVHIEELSRRFAA